MTSRDLPATLNSLANHHDMVIMAMAIVNIRNVSTRMKEANARVMVIGADRSDKVTANNNY